MLVLVLVIVIDSVEHEHEHDYEHEFPTTAVASVKIRLGKREGVFDYLDARFRVFRNDYLDNIESEKNIGIVEHTQPGERAA